MSCGIHLGILLVCLIHAEHVCCSWASQALSSQRPDGKNYVGFSQRESVGHHSSVSSYPQNGLRQGAIQPSNAIQPRNSNPKSSLKIGYSQLFAGSRPTAARTQVAPRSQASTKFVQNSFLSIPNLHTAKDASANWANAQMPKRPLTGFSTAVSGKSLIRPSLKQRSYSPMQAGVGNKVPARTRTSASVHGRRVTARRGPKATQFIPWGPRAGAPSGSMFTAPRSYKPSLTYSQSFKTRVNLQPRSSSSLQGPQNFGSNNRAPSGQRFAPTETHNIPAQFGGFAIRRLKKDDKPKVAVRKPAQVYRAPTQQSMAVKPHVPMVQQASNWHRMKSSRALTGPSGVTS